MNRLKQTWNVLWHNKLQNEIARRIWSGINWRFAMIAAGLSLMPTQVRAQTISVSYVPVTYTVSHSTVSMTTTNGKTFYSTSYAPSNGYSKLIFKPTNGGDWSGSSAFLIDVKSNMRTDTPILIRIFDKSGAVIAATAHLVPGQEKTISLPFQQIKPKSDGMYNLPPLVKYYANNVQQVDQTYLSGSTTWVAPSNVSYVELDTYPTANSIDLSFGQPQLQKNGVIADVLTRLIDQFGQSTQSSWTGKVSSTTDIQSSENSETQQLRQWTAVKGNVDSFGGDSTIALPNTSGYFRTSHTGGRWWLVTPQGHAFFQRAIDLIDPGNGFSVITGRAAMFENIDSLRSTYTAQLTPANGKTGYNYFNFYGANLERKYGSGTDPATGLATYLEKFKARASWRLEAWGFNTVGWESNKLFFEKPTLPFVFPLKLHSYYSGPQIASAGGHSIYDPFDSSFSTAVTSAVTSGIPNYCDTSNYLIGYYIDNELPWGIIDTTSYKDYYAIPVNTLALSYDHAAKKEFANDLHAKYGTIANLNSSWGTSIASWTGLENSFTGLPSTATSGLKADLSAFLKRFATQYFSVVSKALKNRDPNHLYLGCRFAYTERPTEVLEACEAYSDAVSANIYAYQLNTEQRNFITSTTKPIIISEFHFGSTDRGPFWSGLVDAGNEASRGPDYTAYVTDLARQYNVVGCAWYPYTDQPTAGEPSDTENGHVGFVSVADIPYSDFIGVVRTTNLSLTKMHNGK